MLKSSTKRAFASLKSQGKERERERERERGLPGAVVVVDLDPDDDSKYAKMRINYGDIDDNNDTTVPKPACSTRLI